MFTAANVSNKNFFPQKKWIRLFPREYQMPGVCFADVKNSMSLFGLFRFPVGWPKGDSRDLTTIYPHFWGVSASEACPVTNLWLAHFGCRKVGKPQLVVYENPSNVTWMENHGTSSVGYRFHCNPMVAIDPNHPIFYSHFWTSYVFFMFLFLFLTL